ncbi:Capsule biosynthesis protein CapA [Legionella massiliensis]|uniref:Capsule biosynthesis protein CapA n=1 Tax=Legionella massiliensis TaxID=1034943 RepID=A0A078L2V4_9GAMM|nr:CapA family protein [Legionella massiliensis]CDZ78424.1 Capsule biosynthesis protein CapA [Legionella massiliensis]CEE14162.1 Capsule biosynthesis protein CapA [Legionella massiliensis]
MITSPYPWHYTLRWPLYYNWPSTRNHTQLQSAPDRFQFVDPKPDDLNLLYCGDIMVQPGDQIPELHTELSNLIQSADLFIGNCESPLSTDDLNPKARYKFNFKMPQAYLRGIMEQTSLPTSQWLLSIANNHSGDQGYLAYLKTYELLKDMGIKPLGRYEPNKAPVHIIKIKEMNIGFTAWTEWMNCEVFPSHDLGTLRSEHIKYYDWEQFKSSTKIDYLFGIPHWEFEFQHFPCHMTRKSAKNLIDKLGIDFLVGTHTHILQPIEWFSHGICAYNLGNFCGLGHAWPVKLISLLEVRLRPDKLRAKLVSYKMHYFFQYHNKNKVSIIPLHLAPKQMREKLMQRINLIFQNHTPVLGLSS